MLGREKRRLLVEGLERRDLMFGTPIIPGLGGTGTGVTPTNVTEVEPNNFRTAPQVLNLGTGAGQTPALNLTGAVSAGDALNRADIDYFALDLRAGDILDISMTGAGGSLDLFAPNGSLLIGSNRNDAVASPVNRDYPAISPLQTTGKVTLSVVITQTARHILQIASDITFVQGQTAPIPPETGSYAASMRVYRPVLESQPVGTKQILFLDFDGEVFPRNEIVPGLQGIARINPLRSFLLQFGLNPEDEIPLIQEIVNVTRQIFQDVATRGVNGDFSRTGIPGQFAIDVRSNLDGDLWGQPHVSRIIVGGSSAEFGVGGIFGVASSRDIGNFDTQETAIVPVDPMPPALATVPTRGNVSRLNVAAQFIGNTIVHEAAHFFGLRHTQPNNGVYSLIDAGTQLLFDMGAGLNGIYEGGPGRGDDILSVLERDVYEPSEGLRGFQDSLNALALSLATGRVGGTLSGRVFVDSNRNGSLNTGESGVAQTVVFADLDRDGVLDPGEPNVLTDASGAYSLPAIAGSYNVVIQIPANFQNTGNSSQPVSVVAGASVSNVNFPLVVLASQTGTVFEDVNGNRVQDPTEVGVSRALVYVDLNNNGSPSLGEPQALTSATGAYTFSTLSLPRTGTFPVRIVVPAGYELTSPTGGVHQITFTNAPLTANFDFGLRPSRNVGTLPESYGIASHGNVTGLTIGSSLENRGVQLRTPLVRGQQATIRITTVNTTGTQACMHGWVDFNGNGSFEANELIINNVIMGSESRDFTFTVPANAPNVLNMRFRYGYPANQPPSGFVNSGEVEDYSFTVALTGNAVVNDRFSVLVNSSNNQLPVLANDNELPQAPMRIVQETLIPGLVRNTDNRSYSYTPPPGFRGTVSFTYVIANDPGTPYENLTLAQRTGTVTITVAFQASRPIAVDDSFDLPQNSSNVPLDVLANDISGNLGDVTVVSARGLGPGTVVVSSGGAAVRYSAPVGFSGTDQFEYTISDSSGNLSTAIGTVHLLPGDLLNDIVEFNIRALDTNGNLLPSGSNGQVARVGQEFDLEVRVKDLRSQLGNIGVGSAFLDLLYSSQLVSPLLQANGSLITSARNIFTNFRTGTGLTPGIIDEIGGLQNSPPVSQPRNSSDDATLGLVLFRLRMRADATGTAEFIGDPADGALSETSLITPAGALGIQNLRFNRARLNIVPADGNFAFAKDDHFITPISNLAESSLNVLANDNPGPSGEIKIIRVTAANNGTVRIDDRGTSSPTDDRVIYSPNVGFNGTDQFTYTIQSLAGEVSTATVTVQVGNSSNDDVILFDLKAKALDGVTDITSVNVGESFKLVASVQDLRTNPVPGVLNDRRGVFAAFADILFDQRLAQISTTRAAADLAAGLNTSARVLGFDINYVNPYNSGIISGDIFFPGVINDVGAAQSSDGSGAPTGAALRTMFEITVRAIAPGQLTFVADPANENLPFTDSLLFEPTQPVDIARIRYTASTVTIRAAGSEFTNPVNRFDVNNDSKVGPVDALTVINHLNLSGPTSFGSGESQRRIGAYVDVNGDNKLTAADVLAVINYLNRKAIAGEPSTNSNDSSLASADVDGRVYLAPMFARTVDPFDTGDDEENEVVELLARDVARVS